MKSLVDFSRDKTARWDASILEPFHTERFKFELSAAEVLALLEVTTRQMTWASRWENADGFDFDRFAGDLTYQLMHPVDSDERAIGRLQSLCNSFIQSDFFEEKEQEMLRIEKIGERYYLESSCSGCEKQYFLLTPAQVNPETGAIAGALDSVPPYITEVALDATQASCYADKVASIVTGALVAYTDAVFDYALLGVGALFPAATLAFMGAIEIQQAVAAALRGDINLDFSQAGYTKSEVIDGFQSQAFQDFLKARLGDDTTLARWKLEIVSARLNANFALNTPTPLHPVFSSWIKTASMEALNAALNNAALECQTGNSIPVADPTLVGSFEVSGNNYRIYDLSYQVVNEGETGTLETPSGTLAAIAGQYLSTVAPDFAPQFQVQSPITPGNYVTIIGRDWVGNFEDGNARTALELAGFLDASNAIQSTGGPLEAMPFTVSSGIPYDGGEGGSGRDRHPADLTLYLVYKD
jgi:hypothetical protein